MAGWGEANPDPTRIDAKLSLCGTNASKSDSGQCPFSTQPQPAMKKGAAGAAPFALCRCRRRGLRAQDRSHQARVERLRPRDEVRAGEGAVRVHVRDLLADVAEVVRRRLRCKLDR